MWLPLFYQKTKTSKFQFDLETVDEEPPRGNATANSCYYYYYYFNSDFYIFSTPKIIGFHVDKNSSNASCFKLDVLLWGMGFSIIADQQRFMSDRSTGWKRESIGHVDPGNCRIR